MKRLSRLERNNYWRDNKIRLIVKVRGPKCHRDQLAALGLLILLPVKSTRSFSANSLAIFDL